MMTQPKIIKNIRETPCVQGEQERTQNGSLWHTVTKRIRNGVSNANLDLSVAQVRPDQLKCATQNSNQVQFFEKKSVIDRIKRT